MNIAVIGSGYVGLVSGASFLEIENVTYCKSKNEVLRKADALVLLTEWKEFRSPDFEEIKSQLNNAVIFDGRNQYNTFNLDENGFEYYQIGKVNE